MFGRLLVPLEEREIIVVPEAAVFRIGQLEVVYVETDRGWRRLFVKTGKRLKGDKVEILSGLKGDEKVALKGRSDV